MKTLSKLQSEAVKTGLQKFGLCFQTEDEEGNVNEQATNWWKLQFKTFIQDQIQKAYEAGYNQRWRDEWGLSIQSKEK